MRGSTMQRAPQLCLRQAGSWQLTVETRAVSMEYDGTTRIDENEYSDEQYTDAVRQQKGSDRNHHRLVRCGSTNIRTA